MYIGWAPLPPGVPFVAGVGIRRTAFSIPSSHWVFVDGNYFLDTSLHLHVFPYERNRTIIRYTVHKTNIYVRNNRVVNEGVSIDRVRRITKKQISKYELKDADKAEVRRIRGGQLEVYRPKIRKSATAKPKKVVRKDEAKARISGGRTVIRKTDKKESAAEREKNLRDVHEREVRILERSQQREKKELEQKLEEERKVARTSAVKERVERKHKEKVIQLQKSHTKEKSNNELDKFFTKQGYNTQDFEFDKIYVNGDNNLENLKVDEDKWKVSLIEEEFKRRMFDVRDI